MCGIYGFTEAGHGQAATRLQTMSQTTLHRGPDDQNWECPEVPGHVVGYGINRLSIIDVAGGRQPISNETGDLSVVLNGEIYNYKELREYLISKGHTFKTQSDTECIVHLYEEHGVNCVKYLRGMFAFCLFDKKRREMFIARDRVGIKPLYYYHKNRRFAFSSEIKGLVAAGYGGDLNPAAVYSYFTYRYILAPDTIYADIHALPQGHYLIYNMGNDTVSVRQWWTLHYNPTRDAYPDAKEKVKHLLTESVRLRLQSEVPLGAFLSGGIDSSLVSAIVAKELDHEINVYNIGYQEANEYGYASLVSEKLGFNYYQVAMTFDDMVDCLDDVLGYVDQPFSDAACFPLYYLSKIVKHNVTVMLSGEGADELFAGYWQYEGLLEARRSHQISAASLQDHLRRSSYWIGANQVIRTDAQRQLPDPVRKALHHYDSKSARTLLSKVLNTDLNTWLPDDLLMKVDKMTMAASVETRVPFLDHMLLEYVASLPDDYKYHHRTTKRILKDVALEMGVPGDVVQRPKMGFTVPIHNLLQGPYKRRFLDTLGSKRFRGLPYINHQRVDRIVGDYYRGQDSWSLFCWVLFMFTTWIDSRA